MTALDTSVCVPAVIGWHEHHEICRRAAAGARLPTHALLESYSVLTRLPPPHRLAGDVAGDLLERRFGRAELLTAPANLQRRVVELVAERGIEGGAVYDALIALVAAEHGETLLTRDARAARTYELLDAPYELLGS